MTPLQIAAALHQIADAIDATQKPSRAAVSKSLGLVMAMTRTSGRLTKLTSGEQKNAIMGLDHLTDRLEKVSKTLNPQDPSKQQIEAAVGQLEAIKSNILSLFSSLEYVDI